MEYFEFKTQSNEDKEMYVINHTDFISHYKSLWLSKSHLGYFIWNDKTGDVQIFTSKEKAKKQFAKYKK